MVPCLPIQYRVLEVEEQQGIHNLVPIPELVECDHFVVINPQMVETGQLVQEESVENPGSKVVLGNVEIHEDPDATVV